MSAGVLVSHSHRILTQRTVSKPPKSAATAVYFTASVSLSLSDLSGKLVILCIQVETIDGESLSLTYR